MTTTIRIFISVFVVGLLIYLATTPFGSSLRASFGIGNTITTNITLEDGLVGHWTFDGPDIDWGDTLSEVKDISGGGNNGGARSGVGVSSAVPGIIGQALDFDGINDYVDLASFDETMLPATIVAWVKSDGTLENLNGIVFSRGSSVSGINIREGNLGYHWNNASDTYNWLDGPTIPEDTWALLVLVIESTQATAYVGSDGTIESAVNSVTHTVSIFDSLHIAQDSGGSGRNFDGAIDDIRIYNRALSADEVQRLYNLGEGTKISQTITTNDTLNDGLAAHWTFDGPDVDWGDTATEIKDVSGNGEHASAVGMSTISVTSGRVGQALKFNGTSNRIRSTAVLIPEVPANGFATSFWFKPKGGSSAYVFEHGGSDAFTFRYDPTESVYCRIRDTSSGYTSTGNYNVTLGTWYHVACVLDQATDLFTLYINGESTSSVDASGFNDFYGSTNSFSVGGRVYNSNYSYSDMDDFRVYDRSLSANEVARLSKLGQPTEIAKTNITVPALQNGLVGHWTFDGPDINWSDTTSEIKDVSGNNFHGDAVNMSNRYVAAGVIGQAGDFSGLDNAHVNMGSAAGLDDIEDQGGGGMTVSAWIYPKGVGEFAGNIIGKSHNPSIGTGDWVFSLASGDSKHLKFHKSFSVQLLRVETEEVLKFDTWQHVLVTWDGGSEADNARIYVNGIEVGTFVVRQDGIGVKDSDSSRNLEISEDDREFDGPIDDVRIYNRILSAQEISQLYQMGQ